MEPDMLDEVLSDLGLPTDPSTNTPSSQEVASDGVASAHQESTLVDSSADMNKVATTNDNPQAGRSDASVTAAAANQPARHTHARLTVRGSCYAGPMCAHASVGSAAYVPCVLNARRV